MCGAGGIYSCGDLKCRLLLFVGGGGYEMGKNDDDDEDGGRSISGDEAIHVDFQRIY